MRFKKGDKVVCVNTKGDGYLTLSIGSTYEVVGDVLADSEDIIYGYVKVINDQNNINVYRCDRFVEIMVHRTNIINEILN